MKGYQISTCIELRAHKVLPTFQGNSQIANKYCCPAAAKYRPKILLATFERQQQKNVEHSSSLPTFEHIHTY